MTRCSDEDSQERRTPAAEEPLGITLSHGSQASAPGPSPQPLEPRPHRDPNRYQVIGEHGRGGLGRVTRAHDRELGRDIAIKELISRGHLGELRFLREALITARLEHPGIVPVYEAGTWPDGTPFYAMKLVAGRPLRALISERTTVEDRLTLLHHVIAVTDAIAYAHGRGVIHRDLKPSNVIVGDFGETVVIDWGLAKDLGAPDDTIGGSPSPVSQDDGLTSAGSVLGTPAYMAPEQARGEPVDQRADVFAIGVMLWELCSLVKVPPRERALRQTMLRAAGIDRDLIEIAQRALATDPADRYPHAGALAADLKAFKAGARIASRHYSLLDTLGHWARRHRAAAVSVLAALIAVVSGSAMYVHGIAAARDRADASSNNLILEHAQSLMTTNPTAGRDLLQTYAGPDVQRLDMLRAEARGRGTSILLGRPHTKHMTLVRALDDGTVLSVGADGTVTKTSLFGTTRAIARDVAPVAAAALSPDRHLLAYACDNAAVCLLDTRSEATPPGPLRDRPLHPFALALSPDGARLAAVSNTGELTVWALGEHRAPVLRLEASAERTENLTFVDDDTVLVAKAGRARVFHVGGPEATTTTLDDAAGDIQAIDVVPGGAAAVLGTSGGHVIAISTHSGDILGQAQVCDRVRAVVALDAHRVAYGCSDGTLGAWRADTNQLQQLARAPSRIDSFAASPDGCCLYAGTKTGPIVAYNFATQLSTTYVAHTNDVLTLQPASPRFPYLTSSDYDDSVRVWSLPAPTARLALQASGPLASAAWLMNRDAVVTWGRDDGLYWLEHGQLTRSSHHAPEHETIVRNATSDIALYGANDEIELWSTDAGHARRTLRVGHGVTYLAAFTDHGAALVVGSEDGTLTRWSTHDETHSELAVLGTVPLAIRECGNDQTLAITDWGGGIWMYEHQRIRFLARAQGSVTSASCSADGTTLAIVTSDGDLRLYDRATGRDTLLASTKSPLRLANFSPDGSQIIAIAGNQLRTFRLSAGADRPIAVPDRLELPIEVNYVIASPDNQWLAATCNNGDLWFYRRSTARWTYASVGAAKIEAGRFSEDSTQFATADASGRLLLFDMTAHAFRASE